MEHYSNYNTLIYNIVLFEQMQSSPNNVVVQMFCLKMINKMMFWNENLLFDLLDLLSAP